MFIKASLLISNYYFAKEVRYKNLHVAMKQSFAETGIHSILVWRSTKRHTTIKVKVQRNDIYVNFNPVLKVLRLNNKFYM